MPALHAAYSGSQLIFTLAREYMRFVLITICAAVVHRVLVFILFLTGFFLGWKDSTHRISSGCFSLASYLDFPFFIFAREYIVFTRRQYIRGREPHSVWTSDVWSQGLLGPFPDYYQIAWSLLVGIIVAAIITIVLRRRKGQQDDGANDPQRG